jgi:hypothetical protein
MPNIYSQFLVQAFPKRQVAQVLTEQSSVPSRIFGEFVIRDHKRASLCQRQMVETRGWHLVQAQLWAREQSAMPRDHVKLGAGQQARGSVAFGASSGAVR